MGPIDCPETSVRNYRCTLQEERSCHVCFTWNEKATIKLSYSLLFTYCEWCDCLSVVVSSLSAINVTRSSRISAALLLLIVRFVLDASMLKPKVLTHRTDSVSVSRWHRGRLKWASGNCSPPLSPILTYEFPEIALQWYFVRRLQSVYWSCSW